MKRIDKKGGRGTERKQEWADSKRFGERRKTDTEKGKKGRGSIRKDTDNEGGKKREKEGGRGGRKSH